MAFRLACMDVKLCRRKKVESLNVGLLSVDRNSKATLPLTTPRSSQVVCRRFRAETRTFWLQQSSSPGRHSTHNRPGPIPDEADTEGFPKEPSLVAPPSPGNKDRRCRSSVDEDLRGVQS